MKTKITQKSEIIFLSTENTVLVRYTDDIPFIYGFKVEIACSFDGEPRKLLFLTRDNNLLTLEVASDCDVNAEEAYSILLSKGIDCLVTGEMPQTRLQRLFRRNGTLKTIIGDSAMAFINHSESGYKTALNTLRDPDSTDEDRKWAEWLMQTSIKLSEALEPCRMKL